MDWVDDFYSVTGSWWGEAEAKVSNIDRARSRFVNELSPAASNVLELGCGYGATAIALSESGLDVIAVDLSDRIEYAPRIAGDVVDVRFVRDDFYKVDLGVRFDVVCYWDGFGIGEDDDQLRLLKRIAKDWLRPHGTAVVEVFHPDGWKADDGLEEVKEPSTDLGYKHRLGHRRSFDPATSRAFDSWWEIGSAHSLTQTLRCYEPEEFKLLASRAGLKVLHITDSIDKRPSVETSEMPCWSYFVVLQHGVAPALA